MTAHASTTPMPARDERDAGRSTTVENAHALLIERVLAFEGLSKNPHIFFAAATVMAIQAVARTFAPLRRILGLAVPPAAAWPVLGLTVVLPVAIVEVQKLITRYGARPAQRLEA